MLSRMESFMSQVSAELPEMEYAGVQTSPTWNSSFSAPTAPMKTTFRKDSSAHTARWSIRLPAEDPILTHAIFSPSFSTRYPAIYAPSFMVVTRHV